MRGAVEGARSFVFLIVTLPPRRPRARPTANASSSRRFAKGRFVSSVRRRFSPRQTNNNHARAAFVQTSLHSDRVRRLQTVVVCAQRRFVTGQLFRTLRADVRGRVPSVGRRLRRRRAQVPKPYRAVRGSGEKLIRKPTFSHGYEFAQGCYLEQ